MTQAKVVRKGSYQGVPQWGISTSAEITPSKQTAEKWARLENAAHYKTAIKDALTYAGNRWSEWGERAEAVETILRDALDE